MSATAGPGIPQLSGYQAAEDGKGYGGQRPIAEAVEPGVFVAVEERAHSKAHERRGDQVLHAVEEAGRRGRGALSAKVHGGGAAYHAVRALNEERDERQHEARSPGRVDDLREHQEAD